MTAGQPTRRQFEQTHWSTVMRVDDAPRGDAQAALLALCLRFWYPVYAYLRRFGHGPETAQNLARHFLQHLFAHLRDGGGAARAQGRFRQYLLTRLREFQSADQAGAPEGERLADLDAPPPDLEARFQRDNADAPSPEQAYQQAFALELLARALARLEAEARETGHGDMYDLLQPYLAADPSPDQAEELARRLKVRPMVLAVAQRRLRQRFRELIDSELADTVASADEMLAEQQALFAILSGAPA